MKQSVGIIQDPRGHPVRQDANGTPAEVKTGPYLLDDGVSLEAPIPVIIVTDDSYRDSAGNLRGVWPMNITGLSSWSPLDLFEDGTYTGRLYDFKQSSMWVDDGVTIATAGQSVQRIEDLTGGSDAIQATSSSRGIMQEDGSIRFDGLDDFYFTEWVPPDVCSIVSCFHADAVLGTDASVWGGGDSEVPTPTNVMSFCRVRRGDGLIQYRYGGTGRQPFAIDARDMKTVGAVVRNTPANSISFYQYPDNIFNASTPGLWGDLPRYLGSYNDAAGPTTRFKGLIYGFLVIDRVLTEAEVFDIMNYWMD